MSVFALKSYSGELVKYPFFNQERLTTYSFRAVGTRQRGESCVSTTKKTSHSGILKIHETDSVIIVLGSVWSEMISLSNLVNVSSNVISQNYLHVECAGPMVYGATYCPISHLDKLKELGFADSKTLNEKQREDLFGVVQGAEDFMGWLVDILSPSTISNNMLQREKYSLNAISHDSAIGLIQSVLDSGVNLTEHVCGFRKIQIVENFWSPWKMAISEPKSAHLREVLFFAFNWKKSATEAHRMLEEVYGDHALKSQCDRWFKKFQSGDFELDNEPREKPPQKFEDADLQALLDEDSTQTQEKLAKQLQVYLDTVGPPDKYQSMLEKIFPGLSITVAKKADSTYPIVSAASICAKVTRDLALKTWRFQEGDQFKDLAYGSGYPNDPVTTGFLKKMVNPVFGFPQLVRFSWSTADKILEAQASPVTWDEDEETNGTAAGVPSITSFFSQFSNKSKDGVKKKPTKVHPYFKDRALHQVHHF
ncbi:RNASEH2A [Cordylochernes scorpioides]|uniref:Ribonuclease n=1 Tax=Cordylochernes scorpioides TaxID=51811 RepID=A0ABY6LTN3_9ARAC|nr:RNASEH2A [Cordylochernes scorpioides]